MILENSSKIQTGIFGFITLSVLVLSIITMAVCFSLQSDVKELAATGNPGGALLVNGTPEETTKAQEKPEDRKPIYVMTIKDGTVVVLSPDGEVLRTVTKYAAFLPEDDRTALSAGIGVYTEEELSALIEDFSN